MKTPIKIILGIVIAAVLVAGGYYFGHRSSPVQAGAVNGGFSQGQVQTNPMIFVNGASFGAQGSALNSFIDGTCNPTFYGTSFAASTTATFVCSVSGVQAGDLIWGDMPKGAGVLGGGAGSLGLGFSIVSAYATTSNLIDFTIANFTGAATSSFAQATTSVEFWDIR